MDSWEASIQKLKSDERQNLGHSATDEQEIEYYQQLETNLQQINKIAAAFRQSDNDPTLAKQINILDGRQNTLNQLIGLDTYIQSLKDDTKKHPQDATDNRQKIINAEQQKQCIQEFQTAWESYQQLGDPTDAEKVNALIQQLQQLRTENPTAPYSNKPIWEDFQAIVDKYTVFEFNGQKYGVAP
jgi:hypothetical protein